jgi:hypothetical protein
VDYEFGDEAVTDAMTPDQTDRETIQRIKKWCVERSTDRPEKQSAQILLWELAHILDGFPVPVRPGNTKETP